MRELLDRRRLVRAGEAETTKLCAPRLDILVGEALVVERLEVLDQRLFVRRLIGQVLRVLGELEVMCGEMVQPRARLEGTGDEVEECRLARTVLPLPDGRYARVHATHERACQLRCEARARTTYSIPNERPL